MALIIGDCTKIYKEVKGLKKEDVQALEAWCEMQKYLPKLTEMQVINFLHSNNFSNEAAKRCIDDFYTVRTHCPEFFAKRDPTTVNLNVVMFYPLPKKTPDGSRILLTRLVDPNPDHYQFAEQIKVFDMTNMLVLNQYGPAEGQVFVHDLKDVTFAHLAKLNLLQMKKFFFYLQECMPLKIKGLHFINIGNLMDKIMTLIRPFMKKELLDVLHTHTTMDSIFKMIPQDCFPSDYGGSAPSIAQQHRTNVECINKHAGYFAAEEKQVINEQLRPGKPKNAGEVFGVEGTFKKLDID